ncbi:MAG: heavy metal translocating P-type ATPase [Arcobacteraceae bacterium]|jgi:heavy metal translocating P-type ATPase|nr:heavy metal translocating P-type ATPase [Arcobacteraceae bacterium]
MNNIRLVHSTKTRLRFVCDFLSDDLNTHQLTTDLKAIDGVQKVRINQNAKSIVFEVDKNIYQDLSNKLQTLNSEHYKSCDTFLAVCESCIDEGEASLNGVIKASTALVATPLIPNDPLKFTTTAFASSHLFYEGMKELFREGLTSKVLEATAVGVSLARRDYTAANATNLMLELGEYIEETMVQRSDELIKELAKPNVEKVWVEKLNNNNERELELIDTAQLKIGDIVVVGTGDTIAIDGHIISGEAYINQVSMTGESVPVKKTRGDRVISGTIVEDGRIKIWAEQVGENTATARIKNYIAASLNEKSSIGLKATKLADKLVPITLGLAVIAYVLNRDFENVAAVLQADYSCALKLATPVAFKSSISQAGKNGIMIKGAKSIESLANADTFVFDKTGTLTHGELEVTHISSFDDSWCEEDILNLTASAEEHYFHPVAQAVVNAAKEKGFVHMHHEEVDFIVAHGVKTIVNGKEVVIGSRHFLEEDEQIDFSEHLEKIEACLHDGKILLYVGYDKKLLGTIGMHDKIRENAKSSLQKLKSLGAKKLVMLTGDVESKAQQTAKELGIDKVYANLKPDDKANIIKQLQNEGAKVAFVGDGINDAPALISSNVGISMSKGADIAKATADVSLLKDDINAIAEVKELANKTMDLINKNFNTTVVVNSMILGSATLGLLKPISTAVLHNGTTIFLLLNSLKGIRLAKA